MSARNEASLDRRPVTIVHCLALCLWVGLGLTVGLVLLTSNVLAQEAPSKSMIAVWIRSPGDADDVGGTPLKRSLIDIDALPLRQGRHFDAQYRRELAFLGLPLSVVLESFSPPLAVDLALLHFGNGMIIPLPFRDSDVMTRLDPWVARAAVNKSGVLLPRGTFPRVTRKNSVYVDVPAISFAGNKIVVAEPWHPALSPKAVGNFSPWAHADALTGIEFVQSGPYYRQFESTPVRETKAGFEIFKQTCQFCHGARKVGAAFGWDFVEPAPLYTYRGNGRLLFYHVAFRRFDATDRQLMMPALKYMTKEDADNLWVWLKAIGTTPMTPYAPAATVMK